MSSASFLFWLSVYVNMKCCSLSAFLPTMHVNYTIFWLRDYFWDVWETLTKPYLLTRLLIVHQSWGMSWIWSANLLPQLLKLTPRTSLQQACRMWESKLTNLWSTMYYLFFSTMYHMNHLEIKNNCVKIVWMLNLGDPRSSLIVFLDPTLKRGVLQKYKLY